jgi:hypothetical protein
MPTEHQSQTAVVEWFDLQYPRYSRLFFAIPNAAKRSAALAAYMKAEGLRAGVSDLFLLVPRGTFHGLIIEMKSAEGKCTQAQKEFLAAVSAQGYCTNVCHSTDSAIATIKAYLAL